MAAGACALALAALPGPAARADSTPAQVNLALGQAANTAQSETVIVKQQRLLLKEKNSPSAVTELGTKQIAANGIGGSPATLLRQAPSVFVYQQGLGDNAPELTIRGLRGLEIAATLDGIPTQDLLAPGAFYLANNIGGVFTTNQISGVSIYPGVAYPDKTTFGTIGGTVAYDSKRPTNDFYLDLMGSVGSFGTDAFGFDLNSGAYDSPLGTGDNAAKVLLNYRNFQTEDFIDGLANRENEMEFAFDKPYNDGLSKFQATVLYNTGDGFIQAEPVPVPYLEKNGMFSNYPTNLDFTKEYNDWLTIILKNDTYVNDYLNVGVSAFYIGNDNNQQSYGDIHEYAPPGGTTPLTVNGAGPFINNAAGFGYSGYYYGPNGGFFGPGTPSLFYGNPGNTYNPAQYYNNPKACPKSVIAAFGGANASPCGLNDQIMGGHTDTYGIQPRATIILPEVYGIANTIKVGGLFAKETAPSGYEYFGAFPNTPENASSIASDGLGGSQRSIYSGYIQDKIDVLDDTLHLTPGGTVQGSQSSTENPYTFNSKLAPLNLGTGYDAYGPYKGEKWDREYLPFVNVSYDFDKILPIAKGLTVYGSFANSALFAPINDFGPQTFGPPPGASIVHLYEAGVKYNVSNILLSADYFYQKVDRDFGFFSFQAGPDAGKADYNNDGQREFKGEEAAITWQVTPSIQLFGNVSHLSAKYLVSGFAFDTVAEDQYGIELKGNAVSGVPDWLSTFGADYSKKSLFMDSDALNIRLTGQYTGHQYTTFDYGGNQFLDSSLNFQGLEPLNFTPGSCSPITAASTPVQKVQSECAYVRYQQVTGATVTNQTSGGISPFAVFNLDANYTLPTPYLPILKKITFDANIQNLFDQRFFQYFYAQIPPNNCGYATPGNPFYIKGNGTGQGKQVGLNNYSCSPQFQDGIPGQPFGVYFTVTARF